MKKVSKVKTASSQGVVITMFLAGLGMGPQAHGEEMVFGLKSQGSGPVVGEVPNSMTPVRLYSFAPDGSQFADLGLVQRGGENIDADALASSPAHGLIGFEITHDPAGAATASAMISIDPTTAVATVVGTPLAGNIRGATFDANGVLWAVDADSNELLQIDPSFGTVISGSTTAVSLGGSPFDVGDAVDIAVRGDGTLYLTSWDTIYTVNPQTGQLATVRTDPGIALAGATMTSQGDDGTLITYEINGTDDIFGYNVDDPGAARSDILIDILPALAYFNAGRGDLTSIVVTPVPIPEPSALATMVAIGGSILLQRRQRRVSI